MVKVKKKRSFHVLAKKERRILFFVDSPFTNYLFENQLIKPNFIESKSISLEVLKWWGSYLAPLWVWPEFMLQILIHSTTNLHFQRGACLLNTGKGTINIKINFKKWHQTGMSKIVPFFQHFGLSFLTLIERPRRFVNSAGSSLKWNLWWLDKSHFLTAVNDLTHHYLEVNRLARIWLKPKVVNFMIFGKTWASWVKSGMV